MRATKLATEFKSAEDSPGFLLWKLSNKWQAKQRTVLKPFGLTHVQFVLLATLTYTSGRHMFTQKQLAEYAETDVMMTSQVIRKLEQKKLVQREPSKDDARAFVVTPTRAGMALANQAVKEVERVDREFFRGAGSGLPQLVRTMRRLAGSDDKGRIEY
jgi:MarR family transcriptional regulator, organic hydroperoxide resistance regulator